MIMRFGLFSVSPPTDYQAETAYAIDLHSDGIGLEIREDGNTVYTAGDLIHDDNDIYKIEVKDGIVKYYKNNILIYTSTRPLTYPLYVGATDYYDGQKLADARVSLEWT